MISNVLLVIDVFLVSVGVILAAIGIIALLKKGATRDPLAGAPARSNTVLPEHVVIPVLGFLIALLAGATLADGIAGNSRLEGELLAGSAAQLVGAVICFELGRRCFRRHLRGFLIGDGGWSRPVGLAALAAPTALATCYGAYVASKLVIHYLRPEFAFEDHTAIHVLHRPELPAWLTATVWIGSALIAPVAEEAFFRGIVQTALLNVTRRRWAAVAVSAVLFGLAHGNLPQVVPTLILLGLVLGFLYERTGALLTPIVLHIFFNLKTLVWDALATT